MKIRDKLFFGFGLYVFFAAAFGFFAYREMGAITKQLQFLEVADDVSITMLEVRRYEKNFLLYRDKDSLPELRKYIDILEKYIDNIRGEIISEIGVESYDAMKKTITEYKLWAYKVVETAGLQDKQVSLIREVGRDIERKLSGRKLQTFLVLRRYEKNLIIYKDSANYETFLNTYASLGLKGDGEVAEYKSLVDGLYNLYDKERLYVEKMRSNAREVQSYTVKLSRKERSDISATLKTSMRLLLYAVLTIIALGIAINIELSMSIGIPLRRLEKITKKIAAGDFSESVEVKGGGEVASLGTSFNQMEDKLRTALSDLEHTIKSLQEKQAQLVEAEKLASIGILAAGIAHEINNPLTSVLTFSNLMLEQMPEDDPNRERVKMMAWETNRARIIVRQLLSFAREAPLRSVAVDVNQPVREIVDSLMIQDKFKDIELVMSLAHDIPEIHADPAQVGQVVLNIVLNALHSITPPGRIEVATRAVGGFVEIAVSDTGCGIPEENIGRIFEPFYTTKDTSGTGLGLAVSYGIVKKHRGYIEVKSEAGKGSIFTVRLPLDGQVQGDRS